MTLQAHKPNPMYNMADTYAKSMLEPLYNIIFLMGLYKGSDRRDHLECAAGWIPQIESAMSSLKMELTNDVARFD